MPCGGCRKAPRPVRTPSNIGGRVTSGSIQPSPTRTVIKSTSDTDNQKKRVTGLTYVPK